jgi:hypothetical protein
MMQQATIPESASFVDRRQAAAGRSDATVERRQFLASHSSLRPEVKELAEAVDQYKLIHRRRFITYEELFNVMAALGYHR